MNYTKYVEPTDTQKAHIQNIDDKATQLLDVIENVASNERYRALAKTSLEQAVMWMNKGVYNAKDEQNAM